MNVYLYKVTKDHSLKMADAEWKKRVGITINYSSSGEEDEDLRWISYFLFENSLNTKKTITCLFEMFSVTFGDWFTNFCVLLIRIDGKFNLWRNKSLEN